MYVKNLIKYRVLFFFSSSLNLIIFSHTRIAVVKMNMLYRETSIFPIYSGFYQANQLHQIDEDDAGESYGFVMSLKHATATALCAINGSQEGSPTIAHAVPFDKELFSLAVVSVIIHTGLGNSKPHQVFCQFVTIYPAVLLNILNTTLLSALAILSSTWQQPIICEMKNHFSQDMEIVI